MKFRPNEYGKPLPVIQMIPLIDILFVTLSFFMAMFLHFNFESELSISVPKAKASTEFKRPPGEIIVNISKEGAVLVNQKTRSLRELQTLLTEAAGIYPSQEVVIRADEKAYHEYVVRVLSVCANAKISNISFATIKET